MSLSKKQSWTVAYVILILVLLFVAVLAAMNFDTYQFDPVSVESILSLLIPIFVIAVFLERAQEVFVSAWRDLDLTPLDRKVKDTKERLKADLDKDAKVKLLDELDDAQLKLSQFKAETKRYLFLFSLAAGLLISIAGVRVLRPLTSMDADPIGSQRMVFGFVDILLTGALIGGGSEGVHRVFAVITDFLDKTRDRHNK